ncbi:hypothetical protein QUF90_05620 [Desulfococcaceae bacterium HSG9]|nr:hypothetical protein [Desulfococcaceae bacterium HSG9]
MKLGVRAEVLRNALERVALSAHKCQESEKQNRSGCADIVRAPGTGRRSGMRSGQG